MHKTDQTRIVRLRRYIQIRHMIKSSLKSTYVAYAKDPIQIILNFYIHTNICVINKKFEN